MTEDPSLRAYRDPSVVAHYDHDELRAAEEHLFERFVPKGGAVLDLGVGAGRTTPHLAARAKRYVGLDYSDAMIARCREKYPEQEFVLGDAADLSAFDDRTFDAVVFSFNGLGCLPEDDQRRRCLSEITRVLRPGGAFVFSLHNPRCLLYRPVLDGASLPKKAWRVAYAAGVSLKMAATRLRSPALLRGEGYIRDVTGHGGPQVYNATPGVVRRDLSAAGLDLVATVPSTYPARPNPIWIPWFDHAARKRA